MCFQEKEWIEEVVKDLASPYLTREMYIPEIALDLYIRIAPLGIPDRHMLTIKEVAELLGVHPQKVRRLIWYGHLDAVKLTDKYEKIGRVRVPIGALLAYIIKNAMINKEF